MVRETTQSSQETLRMIQSQELPTVKSMGALESVAYFNGAMPTGVTVSHQGRIFVNFPKWGDEVEFTVAEIRDGRPVAYPNEEINRTNPDDLGAALVSVQSVVIDPADRLWILDTGSPMFQPTQYGGLKLVCVDLTSDRVIKTILFPQDVALPTTYLNDIRFDLRRGEEGMAFITDSSDQGANGIIGSASSFGGAIKIREPSTLQHNLWNVGSAVVQAPINMAKLRTVANGIFALSVSRPSMNDLTQCTIIAM